MDYDKIIRELYADKKRLDRVIRELERLELFHNARQGVGTSHRHRDPRGRKSMSAQERQEVSQRMKRYWANRRSKD
jgi:hypothetical protein